jgi:hypothetical protein
MKLSVHLVAWNGAKYIPYLFDSLRKQTFKDWKLVVWDNHSEDKTVELITDELVNFVLPFELIKNETNLGFSGGHNELYKKCQTEYFLLLNQDMYLEPDCLETLVKFLDEHPDAVAISPRLMRWLFCEVEAGRLENSFSNYVDSLGLEVHRNRRVTEIGNQESWTKKQQDSEEVFGVSGALPMFRKSAIDQIKFSDGNFFDSLYHSYKEDVDVAWRLQSRGLKSFVVLNAVAFHDRTGAGPRELGDRAAGENKGKQSTWVRYHSYKNHLMTLYKNEYKQNFWLDLPWILWYEGKKFAWYLVFDCRVLKGWLEVWKNREKVKSQKSKVKSLRKASWRDIRKWWIR